MRRARHRPFRSPSPHARRPLARLVVSVASVAVVGTFARPVAALACWAPPVVADISDPFREPACRWCPGNRGIEYATTPGHLVRAVAAGAVTFAGVVAGERYVVVRHADGRRSTYGRLVSTPLAAGDVVVGGSLVGVAGDRFHFGLRDGDRYVDPTPLLGRLVYRTRLVPLDGSPSPSPGPPQLRCRADVVEHRPSPVGDRSGVR